MRVPLKEGLFTMPADPGAARLLGSRCLSCTRWNFPAQSLCPYCSREGCATMPLSPRGVVEVCTTVVNRPPGYEGKIPFGFGVVELPEGIRLIARMTDPDRSPPGTPVRLVLEPLYIDTEGREVITYAYEPLTGAVDGGP
ncbi:MAG: Zn-ribbon domain-containing OB-fold protein [Candidatus Binatia bacterium]